MTLTCVKGSCCVDIGREKPDGKGTTRVLRSSDRVFQAMCGRSCSPREETITIRVMRGIETAVSVRCCGKTSKPASELKVGEESQ